MAELDVQPKRKSSHSFLPWLLLALGVIALVFFITRNNEQFRDEARPVAGAEATTYSNTSENAARGSWDEIDFNKAPETSFNEIRNNEVKIKGDENMAIYQVDADVLFEKENNLRKDADKVLTEIVNSINTRYSNGEVRLFGNSDTQNEESSKQSQKLKIIKNLLIEKGLPGLTIHTQADKSDNPKLGMINDDDIRIVARRADK
jgi:hypothetical protein